MKISIHHISVLVSDLERSKRFYVEVLGLPEDLSRPDLGYPGAWIQVGEQQIHLLELSNPDPVTGRPEHGGRDRHVALTVEDLAPILSRLEENAIPFTRSRSGRAALFCRDPDANAVELIQAQP